MKRLLNFLMSFVSRNRVQGGTPSARVDTRAMDGLGTGLGNDVHLDSRRLAFELKVSRFSEGWSKVHSNDSTMCGRCYTYLSMFPDGVLDIVSDEAEAAHVKLALYPLEYARQRRELRIVKRQIRRVLRDRRVGKVQVPYVGDEVTFSGTKVLSEALRTLYCVPVGVNTLVREAGAIYN